VINFIVVIIFVIICVSSFLLTKTMITGIMQGVVNGVIIGTTNYLYRMIAVPLSKLENRKFEEDYNSTLIKKLFFFNFINANISLIYTLYTKLDITEMNNLLIG